MRFPFRRTSFMLLAAMALVAVSCGGGGGGGADAEKTAGKLALIDISVADFDNVALNEIVLLEFTEQLQSDSVRADTIQVREGPNWGRQVPGSFRIDNDRVWFYPDLPTKPDAPVDIGELVYAGFRPGTTYQITLPGAPKVAVVRNFVDDPLRRSYEERFQTALAGSPGLYIDNFLDPLPTEVRFSNPSDNAVDVPADTEITLTFNRRALNPATVTSNTVRMMMLERNGVTTNRLVPGEPLLRQSFDRVRVIFQPTFPLADNAVYRLTAERLEDLVGNDVPFYSLTFTVRVEPPRPGALTLQFNDADKKYRDEDNTTAAWGDLVDDALSAAFTVAGGSGLSGDLTPLPGVPTQMTPTSVPGVEQVTEDGVTYDVYNFRRITIPANTVVTFNQGSINRPIKVLSLFPIRIDGTLNISGGRGDDGENVSSNSALPARFGGTAGPGGTDGADAYTGSQNRPAPPTYPRTQDAEDVLFGGEGGQGGGYGTGGYSYSYYSYYSYSSYSNGYSYGGGGGGGGSRTDGRDGKKGGYSYSPTYNGAGGAGGDGFAVNPERLPNVGGAGGGAGGVGFYFYQSVYKYQSGTYSYSYSYSYSYRQTAAGGGGAGGAITLQSSSSITVSSTGRVLADGGNGGDILVYYYYGGAGGGGAGGSIRMATVSSLNIESGATLSVKGGKGGLFKGQYTYYIGGEGGDGGDGFLCLAATDLQKISLSSGALLTYPDPYLDDSFYPVGSGAPSVGQSLWVNLGVFDPQMREHNPYVDRSEEMWGLSEMEIFVQMVRDDPLNPGLPDLGGLDLTDSDNDGFIDDTKNEDVMSEWVPIEDMHLLNGKGYQHIRVRVIFYLPDSQSVDDQLPYLNFLTLNFTY